MREPLTAKLEIASFSTSLNAYDAQGRHARREVMPEEPTWQYPVDDPRVRAAFLDEADRQLAGLGFERATDWVPGWADMGVCGQYTTTLRPTNDDEQ